MHGYNIYVKRMSSIETLNLFAKLKLYFFPDITQPFSLLSNDRPFGCPITWRDIYLQSFLFIDTSDNAWYNQVHWLTETPYLSIISSNPLEVKSYFYKVYAVRAHSHLTKANTKKIKNQT